MLTEAAIISKIKRCRYEADRAAQGFWFGLKNPTASGSLLKMLEYIHEAKTLEWVIGKKIDVRRLNWYAKANKIYRRNKADSGSR